MDIRRCGMHSIASASHHGILACVAQEGRAKVENGVNYSNELGANDNE